MHQRNLNPSSDADLLSTFAAARSESAFRQLADRHAPWVFASALRQLHDRHGAEDAAQAVFLLLAQKAHAMSDAQKRNLTGWLFNALHYTLRNLRRAHRARQKHEHHHAQQLPPQLDTTQPPDSAEAAALSQTLDAAVARLSTPDRTAILLRFYLNRPIDDIAHTLNISEPAARKRLARALAKLRHHLARTNAAPAVGGSDAFSAATLTLAASHGLHLAPATLPVTIAHLATSSTAIPATLAATIKGASTLMATAKLQTTLLSTALALAIFIPTTLITIHLIARPTTTIPSAPSPEIPIAAAPSEKPHPAPDAEPTYTLAPDQIIALIPPPYPDSRHDLLASIHKLNHQSPTTAPSLGFSTAAPNSNATEFRVVTSPQSTPGGAGGGGGGGGGGAIRFDPAHPPAGFHFTSLDHDPDAAILRFKDNHPLDLSGKYSQNGNYFFTLRELCQDLFRLPAEQVDAGGGQRYLLDRKIPGDFLLRADTPDEPLRAALEKFLSEQLDTPLTLSFHDVPSDTYTLTGKWNPDVTTLDIYTDDNSDASRQGNGNVSPANAISTTLSRLLHAPVTVAGTNPPQNISFIMHRMPRSPDPALILTHFTEQTGLTWSKQSRPLRHITVSTK